MAESFSFHITQSPEQAVEKARAAAEKQGARFEGDASGGRFSAMGVVGSFRITGDLVEVDILERPFFAPPPIIEATITELFQ